MVTPLTSNLEIDAIAVESLVEYLIAGHVHALFALGSSGECVWLSWRKQQTLLRRVINAAAGRLPVYAGVSSNCMDEAVERTFAAAELGADFAVAVPPCYFRVSQLELVEFFTEIADRSPLPVVLYNIPLRTNNEIAPASVELLSRHKNIVGIKDTVNDMARTLDVLERVGGRNDFSYLHGNELLSLPAILYGAKGMVPSIANFDPYSVTAAFAAARNRDLSSLPEWQSRFRRLLKSFTLLETQAQESTTLRLQGIKAILNVLGICQCYMAQLNHTISSDRMDRVREFVLSEELAVTR